MTLAEHETDVTATASALSQAGRFEDASALLRAALLAAPDDVHLRRELAICQINTENHGEAIGNLRTVITADPGSPEDAIATMTKSTEMNGSFLPRPPQSSILRVCVCS